MKKFKLGDKCRMKNDRIKQLTNEDLVVVSVWAGKYEIYTVRLDKHYYNVMGDWLATM